MCPELRSHFRTFLSTVFTRCVQKLVSYGSTATPPAVAHTKRKTYFILKYPSIDILSLLNSYPRKRIRGTEHNKNKLVQRGITEPLRSPSKRGWKKLRHNTAKRKRGEKARSKENRGAKFPRPRCFIWRPRAKIQPSKVAGVRGVYKRPSAARKLSLLPHPLHTG